MDGGTDPLFCTACQKKFGNENVLAHHKKGKKHIKSVNALFQKYGDLSKAEAVLPKDVDKTTKDRLQKMVYTEYAIVKLYEYLEGVFYATLNQIRKKQSR